MKLPHLIVCLLLLGPAHALAEDEVRLQDALVVKVKTAGDPAWLVAYGEPGGARRLGKVAPGQAYVKVGTAGPTGRELAKILWQADGPRYAFVANEALEESSATPKYLVTASALNVRNQASVRGGRVQANGSPLQLRSGWVVAAQGQSPAQVGPETNGWMKVAHAGKTGYVSTRYLRLATNEAEARRARPITGDGTGTGERGTGQPGTGQPGTGTGERGTGTGERGAGDQMVGNVGPIRWIPAHSGNFRRSGNRRIRMIVIHTIEGSESSCINWFKNPRSKVSAHYVVSHAGRITQMVRDMDIAWHARSANPYSIGIENEGYARRNGWTNAQLVSLAKLVRSLCDKYGIPKNRSGIKGHSEVPGNDHSDPGPHFPWARFIEMVNAAQ